MNTVSVIESKLQALFPKAYVVVVAPGWPYGANADIISHDGGELPFIYSDVCDAFGQDIRLLALETSSGALRLEATVKV